MSMSDVGRTASAATSLGFGARVGELLFDGPTCSRPCGRADPAADAGVRWTRWPRYGTYTTTGPWPRPSTS